MTADTPTPLSKVLALTDQQIQRVGQLYGMGLISKQFAQSLLHLPVTDPGTEPE